jgi:hypothetical protein
MASTTCFSGLVEFLQSKQGVNEVVLRPGRPASDVEISSWEKRYGCVLPQDVKMFYLTHNGVKLEWTCQRFQDTVVPVGRINIAALNDLRPLVPDQSQPDESRRSSPSLADLETLDSKNGRVPSLLGREGECSVMVLDYCPTCGHTCLVFPKDSPLPSTTTTTDKSDSCSVWLLDLGLSWHQLTPSFSDYLRLATVHLGLRQWPYALTSNRLSPQYEYWFNEFATHRLEVDQTHYLSHSQQPQQRQEEEVMTGSGCGAVEMTVVDVGKILAAKPSREKSGSGRLKSASSSRQSSQRSATSSRRSAATKD